MSTRWGDADEDKPALTNKQRRTVMYTHAGERVRPIQKPYRRSGCVWVDGSGWVWNPTRQVIV